MCALLKRTSIYLPKLDTSLEKIQSNNYLILIGINKYQDPEFQTLNNAVRDVKEMGRILLSDYGFNTETPFYSELFNEEATREGIYEIFGFLRKRIRPGIDNVIIFYSGHGKWKDETDLGYWAPFDAESAKESTYISNTTIISEFIKPLDTNHTVLISDSCYSGSIFDNRVRRGQGRAVNKLYSRRSRWAFCSGRQDESVLDGPAGGHSPFAQSIIDYLVANESSAFPISNLVSSVTLEVSNKYQQLPQGNALLGVDDYGGQFVFYRARKPDPGQIVIDDPGPPPIITPVSKYRRLVAALGVVSMIAIIFVGLFLFKFVEERGKRKRGVPFRPHHGILLEIDNKSELTTIDHVLRL